MAELVFNSTRGCYEHVPIEERIRTLPCIETMANELMLLRVEVTKLQNAQEENRALREEVARLRQALLETLGLLQSFSSVANLKN